MNAPIVAPPAAATTIRIMIVEDERIVALHLRQQLTRLGYEVTAVAPSAARAFAAIAENRPDLILMDIHIEGELDGIETAGRIRDIPVIFLTAHHEQNTLDRARDTEPFGYLLKPFSERELHATIQMALKRREVERELRASEERLCLAMEAASMGDWEVDLGLGRMSCSENASRIFSGRQEICNLALDEFLARIDPRDRARVARAFESFVHDGTLCEVEFRSAGKEAVGKEDDDAARWLRVQGKAFADPLARPGQGIRRIIGVVQDITEYHRAEERLRQAATVFEVTQEGIAILSPDFVVLSVNLSFCRITGCVPDDVVGRNFALLEQEAASTRADMRLALVTRGQWQSEVGARRKSGEALRLLMHAAAVTAEAGTLTHHVVLLTNVTSIRRTEAQLAWLAHFDSLTGLPNRLLGMDRLAHALERAGRNGEQVGLLFVDLDRFKLINDSLGHAAGDELLRLAADRMKTAVRAEDTVARLGGDEFMVLLERLQEPAGAAAVAQKLLDSLKQSFVVHETEVAVSASIGISLFPDDGGASATLIQAADTAMYAAKEAGRNAYAFYNRGMTADAIAYLERQRDLRRSLARNDLVLHYQPQISLTTGAITGVEALARWQHPQRGLLGPQEFIPFAEKNGLIVDIGEWVLRAACEQVRRFEQADTDQFRLAVNISVQQIRKGKLVTTVREALDASGLEPARLELEITESTLQHEEECLETLNDLQDLGVTIAIDDFGTGYSCLNSLKSFPIQRLKIDRSFIRGIPTDRSDAAIAEAIIAMAHRLDMTVIAEGVETRDQASFLRDAGCEEMQGFLYARPMEPAAFESFARVRGQVV